MNFQHQSTWLNQSLQPAKENNIGSLSKLPSRKVVIRSPKLLKQIVPWHIIFYLLKCFLILCRDGYIQAQFAHECTADLWLNPEQFALGQTMSKDQNLETNFDLIVNLQKHYIKQ